MEEWPQRQFRDYQSCCTNPRPRIQGPGRQCGFKGGAVPIGPSSTLLAQCQVLSRIACSLHTLAPGSSPPSPPRPRYGFGKPQCNDDLPSGVHRKQIWQLPLATVLTSKQSVKAQGACLSLPRFQKTELPVRLERPRQQATKRPSPWALGVTLPPQRATKTEHWAKENHFWDLSFIVISPH